MTAHLILFRSLFSAYYIRRKHQSRQHVLMHLYSWTAFQTLMEPAASWSFL